MLDVQTLIPSQVLHERKLVLSYYDELPESLMNAASKDPALIRKSAGEGVEVVDEAILHVFATGELPGSLKYMTDAFIVDVLESGE